MKVNVGTFTGKSFDLVNPTPEMVCIEDIAHALAYQCRFTGHTREFYSVAQHCVLMARDPKLPGDPMKRLLHDADEAYIGDIAKPWKQLLLVQGRGWIGEPIKNFENRIQKVIGEALGVDLSYSAEVKEGDIRMAVTEIRDLMPEISDGGFEWGYDHSKAMKWKIIPWVPPFAEVQFLHTYYQLKGEDKA